MPAPRTLEHMTAPLGRSAPARRLPTWAKVLIGVAVAAVVVPLALTAAFIWSFSGGWDGIRPASGPDDRRVVRARERAAAPLDRLTTQTLPLLGGTETARARTDTCRTGQNNWKIHDGYTLRCELTDVVVLALPVTTAGSAAELDQRLRGAGYRPAYDGAGLGAGGYGRDGHYVGPSGDVGIEVLTGPASIDPLPTYDVRALTGDPDGVRRAIRAQSGGTLLLRLTRTYFTD